MKTTLLFTILSFLSLLATTYSQEFLDILDSEDLTYDQIVQEVDAYFDDRGRGKHIGYKQYLRWQYWAQRNLDVEGYVIGDTRTTAAYEGFKAKYAASIARNASNWQELGPLSAVNTSTWSSHIGRLTHIAIDPNNSDHLIVTSPGGGVWRTLDEGLTWAPIFDSQSTLDCYAGLISEADADHYLVSTAGSGTYRSVNAGASWTKVNNIGNDRIYTFVQDPVNSSIILAASRNGNVYRSIDAGLNWSISLTQSEQLYDLEVHPTDNNVIYAAGEDGVVFKSTDNGVSFAQVSGPWSSQAVMIAVTPDRPDMLYLLQASGGGFGGLYLSSDQGATWRQQSSSSSAGNIMGYDTNQNGGQAPRDMDIIVSPTDSTEVHIGGIMTWRSTDKGVTWDQTTHWLLGNSLPFVHADIDQMVYQGNKIYVASDGGLFISSDGGNTFIDRSTGLGIRQFYRIGAASTVAERINGGSQDNGTGVVKNGVWYDWIGADGMEAIILDEDADILFGSIQYGDLRKSTNGGASITSMRQSQNGESGNWVTPLAKDPMQKGIIYQGKKHLHKSTTAGDSWVQISSINNGSSRLNEVAIAPSDSRHIYMSYGSTLVSTTDGGVTWDTITPPSPSFINYINVHPSDHKRVILTMNGGAKVRESTDAGLTWSSVTSNLPNLGANCTIYDGKGGGGMYTAMVRGIYYRDNTTTQWTLVSTGLPNANVTELEIVGNKLYAATYGRGLWVADLLGDDCHINGLITVSTCDNQSTTDPTDDSYTLELMSNGLSLGSGFNLSGDITATNLAYDVDHLWDNGGGGFLVSNGPLQLTLTDVASTCTKAITVPPPNDCFANTLCAVADTIVDSGVYLADPLVSGNGATSNNATHAEWYIFSPPVDGAISVSSCGYGVDTRVLIHEGACGNYVSTSSYDDQCSMGPGLSAYASQVIDYRVIGGNTYYIEWDDRWSADGFNWDFNYDPDFDLSECPDQVIVNLDGLSSGEYFGVDRLQLDGTATANLTAKAAYDGAVIVADNFTAESGIMVNVMKDSCIVNDTLDWLIIGGGSIPIIDNDTSVVALEVPTYLDDTITDLDIEIDLNHSYVGDLIIQLVTPSTDTLLLWDRYCGGEDNLHFILDEQADNKSICGQGWRDGIAIKSTGIAPVNSLLPIMELRAVGIWQLLVIDRASNDEGQINMVGLRFKARP